MKGDVVFAVSKGDTLDATYRVEALTAHEVRLVYLPLDLTINLALALPQITMPLRVLVAASPPQFVRQIPVAVSGPAGAPSDAKIPTSDPEVPKPPELVTAESGTRAAHRRRERMQQLPPIFP